MSIEEIGRAIADARKAGRKLTDYPGPQPRDMAEAFAVQDAMSAAMGAAIEGWKVGLTSEKAQEICGVDAPLAGPVFAGTMLASGAEMARTEGDLGVIEAEIGFALGADLPPRDEAYARAEVLAAVAAVHPVFEWVNKRLPGGLREAAEWLVADGVINRGLIVGPGQAFDPGHDLRGEEVRVECDGQEATRGVGANALGDPAEVLVWLANHMTLRGRGLKAGEIIATGLICDVIEARPGVEIVARFSRLGDVRLRVTNP